MLKAVEEWNAWKMGAPGAAHLIRFDSSILYLSRSDHTFDPICKTGPIIKDKKGSDSLSERFIVCCIDALGQPRRTVPFCVFVHIYLHTLWTLQTKRH